MIVSDQSTHTPQGAAATKLILGIFLANGRLMRAGDALGKDLKLTSARWQVMGAIASRPKTVAQVARDFELTRQGVLWVVGALLKDGLVHLIDNPDHRRAKLVQLTEVGATDYAEMLRRQSEWVNRFGANFSVEELTAALEVIERFGAGLADSASERSR
jgi:DNA-binding MarR family transcriptional regulator